MKRPGADDRTRVLFVVTSVIVPHPRLACKPRVRCMQGQKEAKTLRQSGAFSFEPTSNHQAEGSAPPHIVSNAVVAHGMPTK